jgi:hypothetical protein
LKDNEIYWFEEDLAKYLYENKRAVSMNVYIKYKSYYTTEGEEFIDESGDEMMIVTATTVKPKR